MKWLGRHSPFHLLTNPSVINRFIFGQGVVIYYVYKRLRACCGLYRVDKVIPPSNFKGFLPFVCHLGHVSWTIYILANIICCDDLLESPRGGDSNRKPQHMILRRTNDNYARNLLESGLL